MTRTLTTVVHGDIDVAWPTDDATPIDIAWEFPLPDDRLELTVGEAYDLGAGLLRACVVVEAALDTSKGGAK